MVPGPWNGGSVQGFYIQQALVRNGAFFDMGEAWDLVQQNGIDPWLVNKAFMEEMAQQGKRFVHVLDLSAKRERLAVEAAIDLSFSLEESERGVIEAFKGEKIPYRYKEMLWLRQQGYRPVRKGHVVEWLKP